jgi:hypothetical protein
MSHTLSGEAKRQRLGDDLIRGASAIAHELDEPVRRINYMLERGQLPARKVGGRWYASRSQLRAHFIAEATKAGRSP